jgi:hypothetical protein
VPPIYNDAMPRPGVALFCTLALALVLALALALALSGCSTANTTPPAVSSSAAVPTPGQTNTQSAVITKVLVFVEENHSLDQMRSDMPYTFGLAQQFGYATHYTAIRHPSLPNYIAIVGGQTYGITDDRGPSANPVGGASVFGQAIAAGKTAMVYAEGMSTNCATTNSGSNYAVKHNAWVYFTAERGLCKKFDVPTGRLSGAINGGELPTVGMVIPNLCNDAHDCPLGAADAWFQGWMAKIFAGPDWKSGHLAVVLTGDEDDSSAANAVLTVVIHPSQHANVVTSPLTHYSLTRLYEEVAGTSYLFGAASAPSMATAFGLPLNLPHAGSQVSFGPRGFVPLASDTPNSMDYTPGNNISVSLSGDDDAELRGYWNRLSDGGTVAMPLEKAPWGDSFGQCIDKFGISWLVNISGS